MRTTSCRAFVVFIVAGLVLMSPSIGFASEKSTTKVPRNDPAWEVAVGMEEVFIRQMLQSMRKTVPEGGYLSESSEAKIYRSLLDEEYADIISQRGEMGVAELVYDHLKSQTGRGP